MNTAQQPVPIAHLVEEPDFAKVNEQDCTNYLKRISRTSDGTTELLERAVANEYNPLIYAIVFSSSGIPGDKYQYLLRKAIEDNHYNTVQALTHNDFVHVSYELGQLAKPINGDIHRLLIGKKSYIEPSRCIIL